MTIKIELDYSPIVTEALLDIGMPYRFHRGCPDNFIGCGGPYHGFYAGVCTDLALDAYNAGIFFNIQDKLVQDYLENPDRYSYGSARWADDMRRYFIYNQQMLDHTQPYQLGDIAFFDWHGDGITNHVNIISEIDLNGRPLKMIDATGVDPVVNPSGLTIEHNWSTYYDQHVQGHGRVGSDAVQTSQNSDIVPSFRLIVYSPFVEVTLFDGKGKLISSIYEENLVASNNDAFIPYIPGGTYSEIDSTTTITVYHPLANSALYLVELTGQQSTTINFSMETLQNGIVTRSQIFTQTIGAGETYTTLVDFFEDDGTLVFAATSPDLSPDIEIPDLISLSTLRGVSSVEGNFTISEASGYQSINDISISVSNLHNQMGSIILGNSFVISPNNFSIVGNNNQQITIQTNIDDSTFGTYLGNITITTQNAGTRMVPFVLEVKPHKILLPTIMR